MPKKREKRDSKFKLVIFVAVGIVAAVVGLNAVLISQAPDTSSYVAQLHEISDESRFVTQIYEDAIGQWKEGAISDEHMITATDENLNQLENLLLRLRALDPPDRYQEAHDMLILSLEYEHESNEHMRSYVQTRNEAEFEKSTELLQLAFNYESEAFAAFAAANKNS